MFTGAHLVHLNMPKLAHNNNHYKEESDISSSKHIQSKPVTKVAVFTFGATNELFL